MCSSAPSMRTRRKASQHCPCSSISTRRCCRHPSLSLSPTCSCRNFGWTLPARSTTWRLRSCADGTPVPDPLLTCAFENPVHIDVVETSDQIQIGIGRPFLNNLRCSEQVPRRRCSSGTMMRCISSARWRRRPGSQLCSRFEKQSFSRMELFLMKDDHFPRQTQDKRKTSER